MKTFFKLVFVFYSLYSTKMIFADPDTMIEINSLIKYGYENNKDKIRKDSLKLTAIEKKDILETNKFGAELPIVANILLRFGMGSYFQGDLIGGIIGTSTDLLSFGFIYIPLRNRYGYEAAFNSISVGIGIFLTGSFVMIIKPIFYAKMKNEELSNILFNNEKVTFLFTPFQRAADFSNKEENGVMTGFGYRF